MKTKMLVLFALALLGTAGKATAQAADKKAARKEKKELRQSIDRARHQQALDAILDSAFVLQANAVLLENYPREQVDFHRNFVSMEGGHFSIQMSGIAANPVLKTGGEVSRMRIRTDKKGFVRCRIDLSGIVMTSSTVYLTLYPDSNEATATVRSLRGGRGVTLEGVIVPAADAEVLPEYLDLLIARAVPVRAIRRSVSVPIRPRAPVSGSRFIGFTDGAAQT